MPTRRAARRVSGVEHAGRSRRADPAGDPGAHRHHRRDGRGAPTFSTRRRRSGRGASTTACSSRTTRASTTASSSTRSRASARRSPRACCARCGCRGGCSPTRDGHGLDAVIARHGLALDGDRHRALGDARALWAFVQALYRELAGGDDRARGRSASCASRACRRSSPPDALDALPEAPGVYRFYGDNPLPLYIGKSIEPARARRRAFLQRLAQRNRPAAVAGDPPHRVRGNRGRAGRAAARGDAREGAAAGAQPRAAPQGGSRRAGADRRRERRATSPPRRSSPARCQDAYGPFASRRGARETLRTLAAEHRLCWRRLGLERRRRAVLSRAVAPLRGRVRRRRRRCNARCAAARQRLRRCAIPRWPYPGPALRSRERRVRASAPTCTSIRDWCWLGTARDDGELAALLEAPPRPQFDIDVRACC